MSLFSRHHLQPKPMHHKIKIMARGIAEYILSDKAAAALRRDAPHHPRIKRSQAAKLAIADIARRITPPSNGERISFHRPPHFVKEITNHYNTNYLSRGEDLQLNCLTLWRIFFRRRYGRQTYVTPLSTSLTHQAIYIQKRHNDNEAHHHASVSQKRKKNATTRPIGPDYPTISNVTTIDQSGTQRLQYVAKNLHIRPHGSINQSDMRINNVLYDFIGISHKTLSAKSTGVRGVSRDGDITVAFSHAKHFINIESRLTRIGHFGGLDTLERNLADYILANGISLDRSRLQGKSTTIIPLFADSSALDLEEFNENLIIKTGPWLGQPCLVSM